MFADGVDDECLDLHSGYALELCSLVRLPLIENCREVVAIAHAVLDGMRRRHAVATRVKDATRQERLRFLPGLGMIGPLLVKLNLNRLEQRSIEDGLLFA